LLSFFQELFTDTLEEGGRGREREGERELWIRFYIAWNSAHFGCFIILILIWSMIF
jgi:hypothetical protein